MGGAAGAEAAEDSSSGLSTPPPASQPSPAPAAGREVRDISGVAKLHDAAGTTSAKNNPSTTTTPTAAGTKRPRKKKDADAPVEEKPARKTRKPKDPNAPVKPRAKKVKTEQDEPIKPASIQQRITDLVPPAPAAPAKPVPVQTQTQTQTQQHPHPTNSPTSAYHPPPSAVPPNVQHHVMASNTSTPTPRPASSGQLFDPIRSISQSSNSHPIPPVSPQPRVVNRASASPSISSLIDAPQPPPQHSPSLHLQTNSRLVPNNSITSAPASPLPVLTRPPQQAAAAQYLPPQRPAMGSSTAMEIDSDKDAPARHAIPPKKAETGSAGPSSNAPTPPHKPTRQPQAPPPLPTGSGLLSGTPFGGIAPTANGNANGEKNGTDIWLTFDLKGKNNVTINFAREVQQRYGFAALHPRIAARNEKRKQLAAAAAALEKTSAASGAAGEADDMSVDLSEPDKDSEAGEGGDDVSLTAAGLPRQRKKKVEDYDRNDDFIDDTELAWEQAALMAKDGFFVYSGPLITEGEKRVVERADGSVKRGRGRGRGGSTRGDTASGRGSRGGGRGSRGGTTVRKPRVTKADRMLMEQEKHERERVAATLAARPAQFAGTSAMQI